MRDTLFVVTCHCQVSFRQAEMLAAHLAGPQRIPRGGVERNTSRTLIARGWLIHDWVNDQTKLSFHAKHHAERARDLLAQRSPPLVPAIEQQQKQKVTA